MIQQPFKIGISKRKKVSKQRYNKLQACNHPRIFKIKAAIMSDDEVVLLRPDKNQRTLFSLSKVVRLDNTSMCFTLEEIRAMKDELLVASQTKHQVCPFKFLLQLDHPF